MPRTRGTLFAALPLLVVALAGCSTAADDPAGSESQIAADAQAWDLANASCLREAGVDIGDPSGDGGGMAISRGDGLDMDALLAASETCRESTTDELGERPVTASEKESQDEFDAMLRESAECVRDAGYDVTDQLDGAGGTDTMDDVPEGVLEECGAFGSMPTAVTR
ncbi:hypothetical protein [Frigoribacterium sp. MEB024]|uniref:hypothetical protein n=1 Tax=Frigoribacterium sp. MEB024 TaxID=1589899 RepID=UPI0005BD9C7C|nr:hypothetical protein [Frigoribacterium sp. MEB024]KIU03381.1 hypothetical protein SZ60_06340 [Frigoribacterium sp. MEB024]